MKLNISRAQEQKKGMLGGNKGVSFKLDCHLKATEAEQKLIENYNVRLFTLIWKNTPDGKAPHINVSEHINGQRFSRDTLGEIAKLENEIVEACKAFNLILVGMQAYGGEETIDLQPPDIDDPETA